jgi:putative flippase GtrA
VQSPYLRVLNKSFIRWALVGLITTACDYVLFLIFYKNIGSVVVSNFFSGVIATSLNYYAHHRWTFVSSEGHKSSAPKYFLSLVFWWLLSTLLIKFLIDSGFDAKIAKIVPTFIVLPLNYLILNKIVFKLKASHDNYLEN